MKRKGFARAEAPSEKQNKPGRLRRRGGDRRKQRLTLKGTREPELVAPAPAAVGGGSGECGRVHRPHTKFTGAKQGLAAPLLISERGARGNLIFTHTGL